MVILGIDLGDIRTGVALSTTGILASPLCTIYETNKDILATKICELANKYSADKIVLGYPKNMNNSIGPKALETEMFRKKLLKKTDREIILWDERLSTVNSQRIFSSMNIKSREYRKRIDVAAASSILQNYLDFLNSEKKK